MWGSECKNKRRGESCWGNQSTNEQAKKGLNFRVCESVTQKSTDFDADDDKWNYVREGE